VEENGYEVSGLYRDLREVFDLVGEVGDRRAATQTDNRRAVAAGNTDATERRGFAKFKLGALRTLRLAGLALAATATEGTSGTTTGSTTTTATACGTVRSEV
jgi:hypothetical protein